MNVESITLKKETYDTLMFKAKFYDTYVDGKIAFADEVNERMTELNKIELWTGDNPVSEVEQYYKTELAEYKKRLRRLFTLKLWKWSVKISPNK